MKEKMLTMLFNAIVAIMDEDLLKKLADTLLDFVEDVIYESPNKWDDKLLPACAKVREAFGIPDGD